MLDNKERRDNNEVAAQVSEFNVPKQSEPHSSGRGNALTTTVVVFLIFAFFVLTLGSQLTTYFEKPVESEIALLYEGVDSVLFQGVFVRNERPVESETYAQIKRSGDGVIAYTNKNGARLSNNSVIAVVYPNHEEKYTRQRIEELRLQINVFAEAVKFTDGGGADSAQIEAFSGQLADVQTKMLRCIAAGEYVESSEYRNRYVGLQTKINLLRGTVTPEEVAIRIAELEKRVAELEGELSGNLKELLAEDSGWFVSNADGYENMLFFDDAKSLSREEIDDIIRNPSLEIADNVAGKMIDGYRWRMATVVPTSSVVGVAKKQTVELRIGAFPQAVEAVVIDVREQDDGYTVLVFESEVLNEEFVRNRVASVRLLLDGYSGIRLPQSAVVFNKDGERGVFVRNGTVLEFKKVIMFRSDDDFVMVENTDEEGYLQLFDDVVVSGSNLYDGRILSQ
ncbi:MAG: hypothetical protein FWG45_05180 [Oscillospiraceae bacterium]|nr:hypothetical protein [Oscillospiraceae bacterium]